MGIFHVAFWASLFQGHVGAVFVPRSNPALKMFLASKTESRVNTSFRLVCAANQSHTTRCAPKCTWHCETSVCEEACKPTCKAPHCETRCTEDTTEKQCESKCEAPKCEVVCSKSVCYTNCSEPVCWQTCQAKKICNNVCEDPECDWDCSNPTNCPQPKCHLQCEDSQDCTKPATGTELPKLQDGEKVVDTFKCSHAAEPKYSDAVPPTIVTFTTTTTTVCNADNHFCHDVNDKDAAAATTTAECNEANHFCNNMTDQPVTTTTTTTTNLGPLKITTTSSVFTEPVPPPDLSDDGSSIDWEDWVSLAHKRL